jgi:hypothetical protein
MAPELAAVSRPPEKTSLCSKKLTLDHGHDDVVCVGKGKVRVGSERQVDARKVGASSDVRVVDARDPLAHGLGVAFDPLVVEGVHVEGRPPIEGIGRRCRLVQKGHVVATSVEPSETGPIVPGEEAAAFLGMAFARVTGDLIEQHARDLHGLEPRIYLDAIGVHVGRVVQGAGNVAGGRDSRGVP